MAVVGAAAAFPPGATSEAYDLVFQGSASPQVNPGPGFFAPGFAPETWSPDRQPRSDLAHRWAQNGHALPSGAGFLPVPISNPTNPLTVPGPQTPTAATPEPSAALVFGAGFLAVGAALRRRGLR